MLWHACDMSLCCSFVLSEEHTARLCQMQICVSWSLIKLKPARGNNNLCYLMHALAALAWCDTFHQREQEASSELE